MKHRKAWFLGTLLLAVSVVTLSACSGTKDTTSSSTEKKKTTKKVDLNALTLPQLSKEVADDEDLVQIDTTMGSIKVKLFPKQAPKAVENFIGLAKKGYYNGLIFHRVIADFVDQSGDPKGTGEGGESIWKDNFAPEISNQLYHLNGALAMARTSGSVKAKTQSSQFYFVANNQDVSDGLLYDQYPKKIVEAYKNGGTPSLDGQYTVFGQTIEGLDVVQKINAVKTSNDKPVTAVKITKITILKEAKTK